MNKLILSTLVFASVAVQAAPKSEAIYLNSAGRQVGAVDAIRASMGGELTYKCQPQEFSISKSGSSISIKNKKKKLTKEEIETQVRDLQKRAE